MKSRVLQLCYKPTLKGWSWKKVCEVLRANLFLRPIFWLLQLYDTHWMPSFLRKSELHNVTHLARGDRPYVFIPLPPNRKRALTNPLPSIEMSRDPSYSAGYSIRRARQRTEEQGSCLFLKRLPIELRELVYLEVLANGGWKPAYIQKRKGWLAFWGCSNGCCRARMLKCLKGWKEYKKMIRRWDRELMQGDAAPWTIPGVLLTCRAIYSEAISLLYSRTIFYFYVAGDLPCFSRTILPQRLNVIQSLFIDWKRASSRYHENPPLKSGAEELEVWFEVWDIIGKMQSLKELRMELKYRQFDVPWETRAAMCLPIMKVKGLKTFELVVPWNDTTDWEFVEHAPFTILRATEPGIITKEWDEDFCYRIRAAVESHGCVLESPKGIDT